jgi:SAM-dependent methyltransferase
MAMITQHMITQKLRSRLKAVADPRLTPRMRRRLPALTTGLMQFSLFWPTHPVADSYSRSASARSGEQTPVPPRELWVAYGTSAESWLASGHDDCETMHKLLADSGFRIEDSGAVLDLGCAAGRMTRWLPALAPRAQVWGADIWSDAIAWCQDNLTPPCNFVLTTIVPHLPFEDRSMDVVCCGSLFTHIDELADMWFLEVRRILRPGGRLYFTVSDRNTVRVLTGQGDPACYPQLYERTGGKQAWDYFVTAASGPPEWERFRCGDAYMASIGRSGQALVLRDADVLCARLAYGWRRCSVTPNSYGHQTSVLLERL